MNPAKAKTPQTELTSILRDINSYWRRSGVPRRERQHHLGEVRTHLDEAVADGRGVRGAIGPDRFAFAAGWIQANRSHPRLDLALRFIAFVTVLTGVHALLGPVGFSLDGFRLRSESVTLIVFLVVFLLGADIVHLYQSRLDQSTVYLIAVLGIAAAVLGAGVSAATFGGRVSPELPVPLIAFLLLGASCARASWKMRHTRRPTRQN